MILKHFKGNEYLRHRTFNSVVVCGTGESVINYAKERIAIQDNLLYEIGVNDIVKYFTPDYLLVSDLINFDCEKQYLEKHIRILNANPRLIFNRCLENKFKCKKEQIIDYKCKTFKTSADIERNFKYDYLLQNNTSVLNAVSLALYMGFKHIGVIGCDLYNHSKLKNYIGKINENANIITEYSNKIGANIYNLSSKSELDFERMELKKFMNNL